MRILNLALLVLLLVSTAVFAQHDGSEQAGELEALLAAQETGWSAVFTTSTLSQYFGTNGTSFYPNEVQQGALTLTKGPCSYDFWFSAGLDNGDEWGDFDDEVDFTFWCTGTRGKFDFTAGAAYFALVPVVSGDIVRPNFEIGYGTEKGKHLFRPYLVLEIYESTSGEGLESGQMARLGFQYGWQGKLLGVSFKLEDVYDTGAFGFDEGTFWWAVGSLDWKVIKDTLTLHLPTVKCGGGITANDRPADCGVGIGLSIPIR